MKYITIIFLAFIFLVMIIGTSFLPKPDKKYEKAAQEKSEIASIAEPEISKAQLPQDCSQQYDFIESNFDNLKECWNDSDCVAVSFGCPWDVHPCKLRFISKDMKTETELQKQYMLDYMKNCVGNEASYLKTCQQYEDLKKVSNCQSPETVDLMCINGTCMSQSDAMMQNLVPGDLDDIGSHEKPVEGITEIPLEAPLQ